MRKPIAFALCLALSACGSLAPNTDVPQGVYLGLGDKPALADDATVRISESPPPAGSGGLPVAGTSCKNKVWESGPTRERAIAVMKLQAKAAGMNAVYSVSVRDDPGALLKNCWAAITATGVAVRM